MRSSQLDTETSVPGSLPVAPSPLSPTPAIRRNRLRRARVRNRHPGDEHCRWTVLEDGRGPMDALHLFGGGILHVESEAASADHRSARVAEIPNQGFGAFGCLRRAVRGREHLDRIVLHAIGHRHRDEVGRVECRRARGPGVSATSGGHRRQRRRASGATGFAWQGVLDVGQRMGRRALARALNCSAGIRRARRRCPRPSSCSGSCG